MSRLRILLITVMFLTASVQNIYAKDTLKIDALTAVGEEDTSETGDGVVLDSGRIYPDVRQDGDELPEPQVTPENDPAENPTQQAGEQSDELPADDNQPEAIDFTGPLVYHSYKIDDDISDNSVGNGDSNVDPGETIELFLFIGNQSVTTATDVSGIISSSDPYINFTINTDSSYDDIIGWGTELNHNDFDFTVSPDAPCGHLISFDHSVSAAGGYSSIFSFTVPVVCSAPDSPANPSPGNGVTDVLLDPTLSVFVSDPDGDELSVTFYGKEPTPANTPDFEFTAIPDTQFYTCDGNTLSCPSVPGAIHSSEGRITTFISQTEWIAANKQIIAYVPHLGDLVQNADWYEDEWVRADMAMDVLDNEAAEVPYAIAFGNHDLRNLYGANGNVTGDTYLNQYFGSDRFFGEQYYGGHFSFNNNNHYVLFEEGNLEFIGIHLEYDRRYDDALIAWADDLLKQHPTRRGIVVRHALINENGDFVSEGDRVFDELKDNPNLFLLLCGHIDGEYIREEQFNGYTIYTVLSDYQSEPNGGDGWLRRLQFSPENNRITVRSYTPLYDQWDWENSRATGKQDLIYDMRYSTREITTISGVASGSVVTASWSNLTADTRYEWYAAVSDGTNTTISPLWHFKTTQNQTTCYPLTLTKTGEGDPPTAAPTNSTGCNPGEYTAGEVINLTSQPAAGFEVNSWTGTINDSSTSSINQVVMPPSAHIVIVHYVPAFSMYLPVVVNHTSD